MRNRFGLLLPDDVRWAVAEGVSETVIAAVLLLHERSVEQIVADLNAVELEQVIKLVGRSPRVYPPGTLGALKQRRALVSPEAAQRTVESNRSKELAPEKRHAGGRGADPRKQPSRGQPGRGADPRKQPSRGQPGRGADPRSQPSRGQPRRGGPDLRPRYRRGPGACGASAA
jgi:hypothetical protein